MERTSPVTIDRQVECEWALADEELDRRDVSAALSDLGPPCAVHICAPCTGGR
jgi:hypothetical protein